MGYHPGFLQWNWLAQDKEVEATSQGPAYNQSATMVVIPTQQATASATFTQPATVPAVSAQPMVTLPDQSQKSSEYCVICTPTRK